MNSNFFHNLSNVLILLLSVISAGLVATGCVALPTGGFDCTASWIPPTYAVWLTAILAGLKIVVNIARDGLSGLTKPQPPVIKK